MSDRPKILDEDEPLENALKVFAKAHAITSEPIIFNIDDIDLSAVGEHYTINLNCLEGYVQAHIGTQALYDFAEMVVGELRDQLTVRERIADRWDAVRCWIFRGWR